MIKKLDETQKDQMDDDEEEVKNENEVEENDKDEETNEKQNEHTVSCLPSPRMELLFTLSLRMRLFRMEYLN